MSPEQFPASSLPEFAFIGRSNVGKSSLINLLTRRKELATTSSKPGRTSSINFFEIDRRWRLVDLPGYGYAKRSQSERDKFNAFVSEYLLNRSELLCTFALIDSRLPPQEIDLEFTQWLMQCAIPFVLVFTKTDKLKASKTQINIAAFTEAMSQWCEVLPRVYQTSAKTQNGRKEVLEFISDALQTTAKSSS